MALLIDELRKSGTPINAFFKAHFPHLPRLLQGDFLQMKHAPLLVPPTVPGRPQSALVGTAFAYRARTWLNPAGMALDLERKDWLSSALPLGMDLNHRAACIFLAYADRAYRSGMDRSTGDPGPHVLDEVDALHELAKRTSLFGPPSDSIILGPEFGGSEYDLRADADLIADGTAWEITAAVSPVASARNQSAMLWPSVKQAIALALLDWNNDYTLKHAGVYWARHGVATVLSLEDITLLGGRPIPELRERLRDWLAGGWQTEAHGDNAEPTRDRTRWLSPDECLARRFTPALARAMYHVFSPKGTPQEHLEALAVAKLAPIMAGPLGRYLDEAVHAMAAADLERAERGLTKPAQFVLSDAYDIAAQALQFAADDAKQAARKFERGNDDSAAAAETELNMAAHYARNLASRRLAARRLAAELPPLQG